MRRNNALTIRTVKIMVFIILFAFIMILISLTYLRDYAAKMENKEKIILNLYGKQKMYTQKISKESGLIYTLLLSESIKDKDLYISEGFYGIDEIKNSLKDSKESFSEILKATHQGKLVWNSYELDISDYIPKASPYIHEITLLWSDFESAIDVLINAKDISPDVTEGAKFITEHNIKLLECSDLIRETIHSESIKSSRRIKMLFHIFIILLSTITIAALFYLFNFIISFNKLYQGLFKIGLNEIPGKQNFSDKKKYMAIADEINEMFQKIDDLISLIQNINNNSSFTDILNYINVTFSSIIPYNYIGISLLSDDKTRLKASYGVSDGMVQGLPENLMNKSYNLNETSLERLIKTGEARIINDLEDYTLGKPLKSYNSIILNAGIRASITLPLKVSGEPVGIIFFSSVNKNVYHKGHLNFLDTLANSIAISFSKNIYIDNIIYSSVLALAKLAEARDADTGEHLERMKTYSRIIAEILYENDTYTNEITWEFINKIERYSPLHDIGKVGIADSILRKSGKLTEEEFEEMKKHAVYGAKVLRYAEKYMNRQGHSLFGLGIEIAEGHHEKWDGTGYPYGKKGLEIPLSARIVAIADVFDALTNRRSYKEPFTFEESIKIIEEGKGKHFDPHIVELVLTNKQKLRNVYNDFKEQEGYSELNIINM